MKVAIRLALHGCTNRPFYHIVAIPHRRARNGRPLEQLGTYDPMPNKENERLAAINYERLRYYMANGAEPSKPVQILLGLAGFLPLHPTLYMKGRRHRIKEQLLAEQASSSPEETKSES